jgi:acetate kinase
MGDGQAMSENASRDSYIGPARSYQSANLWEHRFQRRVSHGMGEGLRLMKPSPPRILTINGGSSSITFALFEAGDLLRRILEGGIERIGLPEATLRMKGLNPGDNVSRLVTAPDHTAALGGLDTLVFTGGIGENAPVVRTRICDGLGFLGIEIEEERNASGAGVISPEAGRVCVRVIRTDEEWTIAKTVCRILGLTRERE